MYHIKHKKNNSSLLLVVLLLCALLLCACKAEIEEIEVLENEKIIIESEGEMLSEVSLEDIKKLKSYKRRITINSSTGTETGDFRGALLSDVLKLADEDYLKDYNTILTTGADTYFSTVTKEELNMENKVFLMYEKDDKPLVGLSDNIESMRLIVIGDDFGQRFTNYVVKIELIK